METINTSEIKKSILKRAFVIRDEWTTYSPLGKTRYIRFNNYCVSKCLHRNNKYSYCLTTIDSYLYMGYNQDELIKEINKL